MNSTYPYDRRNNPIYKHIDIAENKLKDMEIPQGNSREEVKLRDQIKKCQVMMPKVVGESIDK
jgi:hypothetical protein